MRIKKTYKEFIKESFDVELLPVGSKIQFKFDSGIKKCEIIGHKTNINNEIFYLIKLEDGSEEYIVSRDKRIIAGLERQIEKLKNIQ